MRHASIKKLYLNLGVESAELPEDPALDVESEDTASAEAIESTDELNELTDDVDQLQEFTDVTEGVADLDVAVESAIASGRGLNRIEATALNLALKATMGKYIPVENEVVPARESYGVSTHVNGSDSKASSADAATDATNQEQTKAAKKGMGAAIKAFIQAIIKKIKAIIKTVKDFFKGTFDRMTGMITNLVNVQKRLKAAPGFQPEEMEFNIHNLYIDGKFDPKLISERLEAATEAFTIVLKSNDKTRNDEEKKFLKAGIEAIKESNLSSWDKVREGVKGYAVTTFSKISDGSAKTADGQRRSEEYPGGKAFILNLGSDKGPSQLASINFVRSEKSPEQTKVKIMGPGTSDLEDMLQGAFIFANALKTATGGQGMKNDYLDLVEELDKNFDPKKVAKMENNKEQLSSISNFIAIHNLLSLKMLDYSLTVNGNILQLADQCISRATKKQNEQKKEEKTA